MGIPARTEQARGIDQALPHREQAIKLWNELDQLTQQHCVRVEKYVGLLGQFAGYNPDLIQKAKVLAFIHDAGKAEGEVRDRLYLTRDNTTPEDLAIIKRHAEYGAQRARAAGLAEEYAEIILHHHEDNDGTGYPGGWTREQTVAALGKEAAEIIELIRIADSFDSMVNGHYALANKSIQEAAEEIRQHMQEGRYNAGLLGAFDQLVDLFQAGSQQT